jgi:hypothetical protein
MPEALNFLYLDGAVGEPFRIVAACVPDRESRSRIHRERLGRCIARKHREPRVLLCYADMDFVSVP